ncbi:MAG: MauE/DoxX family redox-associated membrane protein, partial [Myxococcota bacterium]
QKFAVRANLRLARVMSGYIGALYSKLKKAAPLLCMSLIASVFANSAYHQFNGISQFVFELREWGITSVPLARMVARAVIVFELLCVSILVLAIGTGITQDRRFGPWAWEKGRLSIVALLIFLQLTIILYAVNDPLFCGCGPMAKRIDIFIQDVWDVFRLPDPALRATVPVIRNVFLTFAAIVAFFRPPMPKASE